MTLSQGLHIRYPVYQVITLCFIKKQQNCSFKVARRIILWLGVTTTRGAILKGQVRKTGKTAVSEGYLLTLH